MVFDSYGRASAGHFQASNRGLISQRFKFQTVDIQNDGVTLGTIKPELIVDANNTSLGRGFDVVVGALKSTYKDQMRDLFNFAAKLAAYEIMINSYTWPDKIN